MDEMTSFTKMTCYSLIKPALTDEDLQNGCILAKEYDVACIAVQPCFVEDAAGYLKDTDVKVTAVVGTGGSTTAIKVYESEEACRNGAQEIDMFINPGKLLSGDWTYVEQEIAVIAAITNYYKSVLTVSVDHDLLNNDQHKIKFYQLCSSLKVNLIKIPIAIGADSKQNDGYWDGGMMLNGLNHAISYASAIIRIAAEGPVRTADQFFQLGQLGVSRINTAHAPEMLNDVRKYFQPITK